MSLAAAKASQDECKHALSEISWFFFLSQVLLKQCNICHLNFRFSVQLLLRTIWSQYVVLVPWSN